MRQNELEKDEVILLECDDVDYSGPNVEYENIDKLVLTNKRIIANLKLKKEESSFDIKLSDIKIFNGEIQVDYFTSSEIDDAVRIQAYDGVHYFTINPDDDSLGLKATIKSLFSSKADSDVKKAQLVWVAKIKEAISGKSQNEVASTLEEEKPNNLKEVEVIRCRKCGTKMSPDTKFCPSCGTPVVEDTKPDVSQVVEVIRCRKCGAKNNPNTKFCPSCGTPVIEDAKPSKENKIDKCPICGEILSSDAIKCPSCGYEIRGRKGNVNVKEFFERISTIENESKKIEAIKMYPIPNSKEDITEFMFLASSNFDAESYATNKQSESIDDAWHTKIEQCYQKAKVLFADSSDLKVIENLYQEANGKTKTIKKSKKNMIIFGAVSIVVSLIMIGLSPSDEEGNAQVGVLYIIALALLVVGIVLLVKGLRKKKNKQ